MIKVKIGELRNNLSAYLRKVRKGAEIVVMDRETPIGRVVPYQGEAKDTEPFDVVPPPGGYAGLAKLKFPPLKLQKRFDPVEELIKDRRRR
ncbi:MAG: type II toxin-antitoxin system prevent-host-death family antitoxin [Deltaproteobacteria bacterium]|nr:type II toxin-antitoxin system prevent-host-death family antitoxin [Deltaproteobacteria bacterium]